MKKNSQRKPKPRMPNRPAANPPVQHPAAVPAHGYEHGHGEHEGHKVGVVSGTPADAFDETAERKHNKWIAIYISVLAVLLAIAATGSNDAMKTAQQAGFQVNDQYAYYQAKTIRQQQIKLASDQLELKLLETANLAEPAQKLLQSKKADYDKEVTRLESDAKNGKMELQARAESCENLRNTSLAQHPFYDYSMAMLQIAIVLASASIITGARLLLGASGLVGLFGVLLFLNGYTLVYGGLEPKYKKLEALEKALPSVNRTEMLKIARCPVE